MPKINQEEYEVLKGLDNRWKWIARDDESQIYSAELYVFEKKPEQEDGYWNNISNGEYALLEERDDPFQFIQWEDEEPYEITELIREYEIKELRLAPSGTVIVDSFDESEETEVKDIEELKSWFEDDKLYVGEYVKHKINQLDEPEVLSQEWINEHSNGASRSQYVWVDDLQNLIVPKQGKMKVSPQEDEFITECKLKGYSLHAFVHCAEVSDENCERLTRAWLDGYEVEEEPLYYALIKGHELIDSGKVYWVYDKNNDDVFISVLHSSDGNFSTEMSKAEWNKLGINDSNADFVKVEE